LRILRRYSGPVIELDVFADLGEEKDWSYMFASSRMNACRNYILSQGIDPARFYTKLCDMNKEYSNTGRFKILPIYYIPTLLPVWFTIRGNVTDAITHKPIINATVHMLGTDLTDIPHQTDSTGHYQFFPYDFNPDVSYQVKCLAPGYSVQASTDSISTEGLKKSKEFVREFVMSKK
jgi:hypothetical protein